MFTWSVVYHCSVVGELEQCGFAASRVAALAILRTWLRSLEPNGVRVIAAGVWPSR